MPIDQFIFTDCSKGSGVDPRRHGFQIRAVSPGLDHCAWEALTEICLHYGSVVYTGAPREAKDEETRWRISTTSQDAIPEAILSAFPMIYVYSQLSGDLFALTRVRYRGLTHNGRPGNFFAHALVFLASDLAPHFDSPLDVVRLNLFLNAYDGPADGLPTLANFGHLPSSSAHSPAGDLRAYCKYFPEIALALENATGSGRRVIACLPTWRLSVGFVAAVLNSLSLGARCRSTFSTYEIDKGWRAKGRGQTGDLEGVSPALVVLCGDRDEGFGLDNRDYDSRFVVFNFVENKFTSSEAAAGHAVLPQSKGFKPPSTSPTGVPGSYPPGILERLRRLWRGRLK